MLKLNQIVSSCMARWRGDLRELFAGIAVDPFVQGSGRRWERDFLGEIGPSDVYYAIFIGVLSLIPAAIAAYTSVLPDWIVMARFFRAPLQVAISGFLTSVLIFAGSHFNHQPRPFSVAFKLMLRIMSVHPLLGFLLLWKFGEPLGLIIYGFFVIRGVRKTYSIALQPTVAFFGVVYAVFALMTLSSILSPLPQRGGGALPPSKGTILTSSSRSKPK